MTLAPVAAAKNLKNAAGSEVYNMIEARSNVIIMKDSDFRKDQIERILQQFQTKIIFFIVTLGTVKGHFEKKRKLSSDTAIRRCYK
jgi:predicted nuclease of predicted toxin-antitoxin system